MKERTSIAIDPHLRREAQALARRRGISLSSLVNELLEDLVVKRRGRRERFPRIDVEGSDRAARDHERLALPERE